MAFKYNPTTGELDFVVNIQDNFSYRTIVAGKTVTIPVNQLMTFVAPLTVDGTLNIDGEIYEVS